MELSRAWLVLGILLLVSCATQKTPTGGAKDEMPPTVIMADPRPMSTEFSAKKIEIEFSEYVQLQNVREQVLISPPLEETPEISLKGSKRLVIDFDEIPLRPNTTYTINLGKAIQDYTEGNVLEENVYLFSTGNFIDTLELRGRLYQAEFNEPCLGCFAMLYPLLPDTSVLKERPHYIAKSDNTGEFLLANLAPGDYRLFGLKDQNNDLLITEGEAFAFHMVNLSPVSRDSIGTELFMFKTSSGEEGLKSFNWDVTGQSLDLVTSSSDSLPVFIGDLTDQIVLLQELDDRKDSLRIWFSPAVESNAELIMNIAGQQDTIQAGRITVDEEEAIPIKEARLQNPDTTLLLKFFKPMAIVDTSLIQVLRDSIPVDTQFDLEDFPFLSLDIDAEWESGRYILELLPGALTDIYGAENDTIQMLVKCPDLTSFGNLFLNLDLEGTSSYEIELLDKSRNLIRSTSSDSSFVWSNNFLAPGEYFLRVYMDQNKDGQWTSGDFESKRLPEPVFMLIEPIVIRANWDVEQDVLIRFRD